MMHRQGRANKQIAMSKQQQGRTDKPYEPQEVEADEDEERKLKRRHDFLHVLHHNRI